MSRACFPRRDSTQNDHLLGITPQRDGFPAVLFVGSHSLPSFPVAAGYSRPPDTTS